MPTDTYSKNRERKWAWIWIGYTGFLFLTPIFQPSIFIWLVTLCLLAVFLCVYSLYIRATDQGSPVRFWMIGAAFVLGLIGFPLNQGACTFFAYTAAFISFSVRSIRIVVLLYLLECLAIIAESFIFAERIAWPNTFIAIFILIVVGVANIFFAEQKRADAKLRAALEENVSLAAVAERERIARDLHDVLGHTLSVIVLKSELAGRLVFIDPARAISEIGDVETTARSALAEIREAIGGYRARGLSAEIKAARLVLGAAGVILTAEDNPASAVNLSPKEETALALAVREAITNVVRHAGAKKCCLRFTHGDGCRRLVIEDDGKHTVTSEGNGLRGMRERMESLGGRFLVERGIEQGQGTRLTLEIPEVKA